MAQGAVIQAAASKWKRYNFHSLPGVESEDEVLDEDEEGESTPFQKKVGVLLNSVSGLHVTLISSESRVYQLKHSAQVGLSATQSVGLLKWTSDWSDGIRYHTIDTRSDTEFQKNLSTDVESTPRVHTSVCAFTSTLQASHARSSDLGRVVVVNDPADSGGRRS